MFKEVIFIVKIEKREELLYPMLCYDVYFKALFIGRENLLARMVSDITGIDYEILKDNVILISKVILV